MSKTKIIDIANKAQVSITAVSFALNGKEGISQQTRDKILQTAEEIGYEFKQTKNAKKRSSNRGKTVLLLICSRSFITQNVFQQTPFFSELLKAFEEKLSASGYRCLIKSINIDDNFEDNLKMLFETQSINGLLLVATDMFEEDVLMVGKYCPNVVVIDTCFDRLEINCVVMDNYLGGVLAARKAIESGHKHIGYVQSSIRIYNFEMRKKGFFEELERRGVKVQPKDILTTESSLDSSYEFLKDHVNCLEDKPTFYFAESDYMAIGLMKALQFNGVSVPDEVSVVGFDNIEMTRVTTPQLTTINVPKIKMAEFCISQLAYILKHEKSHSIKSFISVDLVQRGT